MTRQYAEEQKALLDKIKTPRTQIDNADNRAIDVDSFLAPLRKYIRVMKPTERMLNGLVERIQVFHAQRTEGEHRQKACT